MKCKTAQEIGERMDEELKKTSNKKIKDFLLKYHEGNPYSDCPKGCKTDCMKTCYKLIHMNLVNDDLEEVEFGERYKRDGEDYCCGKKLRKLDSRLYCEVCAKEYV